MTLRDRFRLTYVNLPLPERDKVAVVVDDNEMNWHVLRIEVENDTEISKKALKILDELNLLKTEK